MYFTKIVYPNNRNKKRKGEVLKQQGCYERGGVEIEESKIIYRLM